jgi:hypothetical protein
MMTRTEKLFNIRAQVQKAASEIEHGDTYAACMALGDALSGVLRFLEEEMPVAFPMVVGPGEGDHPRVEAVKELPALDTPRIEPTKIKRR